jgi:hypothetical protein
VNETCVDCLSPLLDFPGLAGDIIAGVQTDEEAIEIICEILENGDRTVQQVYETIFRSALTSGIDPATAENLSNSIRECLNMLSGA